MKILVFAPHPDDESIGCGGSISKHVAKGDKITIVFFTSGEAIRETEAKAAAKILGVSKTFFLRFKDGFLTYSPEVVNEVAKLVNHIEPDLVYAPHELECDSDHSNAFKIVSETLKKFSARLNPTMLCYEVWTPISSPNYFEDISKFITKKRRSIVAHRSQRSLFDFSRAAISLNQYRGITSRRGEYCEAFAIQNFGGNI